MVKALDLPVVSFHSFPSHNQLIHFFLIGKAAFIYILYLAKHLFLGTQACPLIHLFPDSTDEACGEKQHEIRGSFNTFKHFL